MYGSSGADTIDASAWTGVGITIGGGDGDDTLRGGTGNDTIQGGNGNDILQGNGGNDSLTGQAGNDLLQGGDGNDHLDWNNGNNGLGDDILEGGAGNDNIWAYTANDQFSGGDGNDYVVVQNVSQVVLTNAEYTSNGFATSNHGVEGWELYGSSGADTIDASAWTGVGITIGGGDGDDTLRGGTENDTIQGGNGNDDITGGGGQDHLNGQAGNDTIRVPNSSFSQVLGESGNDRFSIIGSGVSIDLVSKPNSYMQGIEEIDLTGSGNNSLTVNQSRVLSLSDTTDTLIVSANVGDTLNVGSGWTTTGTETINGSVYKVQTNGAATLKVQQATDVNLVLLPLQEVQTLTYSLNNANPDGFSGNFSVVPVQGYQGIGPTLNAFDASFLRSGSSATLTLTNLPEHDRIDVGFLLAIIDSWDGNDRGFPTGDFFNVLVDGSPIFRETFSSFSLAEQSYSAPTGGRLSFGTQLGFAGFADSAYNMFLEPKLQQIAHRGSTLTITWLANGPGWQGGDDESWAIDNLAIKLWKGQTSIPNNLEPNAIIGRLESTDIQPETTFTYSLVPGTGSEDNGYFAISGNEIKVAQPLDASKTSYSIRVRATDAFGVTFEKPIVINAKSTNQAPTDISLSANSIAENAVANANVGTLTTTDPDVANTFAYTLVSGAGDTDNAAFNISGNALRASSSFDFETKSSYSVRVRSTDQGGLWTEKVFTISVTDVNETPTNINLSAGSIAENAGANATVGTLTTIDPDAANTFAYTLVSGTGDTDNAAFNISGTALRASSSFDFETKSSYSVRVRSTDQGGLWTEKVFTISVTDVNETPTNISLSASSIAENSGANATVGTLTTTDPDTANSFMYTLVSGTGDTDNAVFNVDGDKLRASSSFDFETKSSYSVRVRSTDQGGLWTENVFTISVTDANETPTNISLSANSIAENAGANATVGTLTTIDPDAANTFAYTLVSGTGDTDNAAFNIIGNALRASSSFDFETKSSYSVRVRSTDQGGLYTEKVFTINVINTNELVSVSVNGADNFINASQRSQITSVVVVTESVLSDPQSAFSLTNIGLLTASSSSLASSQILVTSVGNVYTLRFGAGAGVVARGGTGTRANSLADGNWILTVAGSEVSGTNQFGNRAVDNFFRMFGDSDGDGDVDGTDAVALRRAQFAASYNAALDWDGNGSVTPGADINFFSLNQNKRRRLF